MDKSARKAQRERGVDFERGAKGPSLATPGLRTAKRPDAGAEARPNPGKATDRGASR